MVKIVLARVAAISKNGHHACLFQQHISKVVHLEIVQDRPPNILIPNNLLQHPMPGKPLWLPG